MRRIFLPCLLVIALGAKAQLKVPVLLRGDFGMSNVKTNSGKAKSGFGYGIGLETFIPLVKSGSNNSVQLSPNLSYLHTGYESNAGVHARVNYVFLGVPLCYAINDINSREELGYLLGVGPYIAYAASGKFRTSTLDDYNKMSFGDATADNRTSTDAGIMLKSAFKVKKGYLGLQYNLGTANVIPKDRITGDNYIKTRNFLFYISFKL